MKEFLIYILIDPTDLKIKYVGKTSTARLKARMTEHRRDKNLIPNNHKNNWIKKLKAQNLRPIVKTVQVCSEKNFPIYEKYWIRCYEKLGIVLTNSTKGGEGCAFNPRKEMSDELKKKISDTLKEFYKNPENLEGSRKGGRIAGRIKRKNTSSKFLGVAKVKNGNFLSGIRRPDGKRKNLGTFDNENDAAMAYDVALIEYFQDYSKLNFPDRLQDYLDKKVNPISNLMRVKRSKYRGIRPYGEKWLAMVEVGGVKVWRETFDSEIEAAIGYNKKSIEIRGNKAILNVLF